jgi:hypothetical protein
MLILAALALAAAPPAFDLPLKCRIGDDCLVQNYVDIDPSPAARDHGCGGRTYDTHNGTDFRIASVARQRAGVAVVAAAAGVVLRARDGVADRLLATADLGAVAGTECGNGLVIDHGGGWSSQYCHMARGSLAVKPGDRVAPGAVLGKVGLSGATQFAHLHFTVRDGDRIVDPFAAGARAGPCGGGTALWNARSGLAARYRAGAVLNAGFATAPLTLADIVEHGDAPPPRPDGTAPALVAFVLALGLQKGDIQHLAVTGPAGEALASSASPPLDRDKAQTMVFTGRKRPPQGWSAGAYRARYRVEREGRTVITRDFTLKL